MSSSNGNATPGAIMRCSFIPERRDECPHAAVIPTCAPENNPENHSDNQQKSPKEASQAGMLPFEDEVHGGNDQHRRSQHGCCQGLVCNNPADKHGNDGVHVRMG